MLFDFTIKYHTGKLNQTADALSHHPKSDIYIFSNAQSKEYETILYAIVNDDLTNVINWVKLPIHVKTAIQEESIPDVSKQSKIVKNSEIIDILSKAVPDMMKQALEDYVNVSKSHVKLRKMPTLAQIRRIKSKTVCRYL